MKTVILAGGLGTRLREETEFRPKPMVNIGNRPILWHVMKIFSHYGYKDFILALGYKGEMIKEYFYHYELLNNDVTIELDNSNKVFVHKHHDESGWKITLVDTGSKALKGARLKRVERYIAGDVFMATYGDTIANIDINALVDFHLSHGKLATVTGVNLTSRFGELKVRNNQVERFIEKPSKKNDFINGGFFVFNKAVLNYLSADDDCDLEKDTLGKIAKQGQMMVYKHQGVWECMDTARDMDHLNKLWNEGNAEWKVWE